MVLEFNPVVTFASLLLILGFVTWAMVSPEQAGQEFTHWKSWVGLNFTWLYIGAQVRTDFLICDELERINKDMQLILYSPGIWDYLVCNTRYLENLNATYG